MNHVLLKLRTISLSFPALVSTFLALVFVRLAFDIFLSDEDVSSFQGLYYLITNHITFYALAFTLLTYFLHRVADIPLRASAVIMLWGFLFISAPPMIDRYISATFYNNAPFLSYYLFDTPYGLVERFFTFFGSEPTNGITFGTRIFSGLMIAAISLLTLITTKNISRFIFALVGSYTILFFLACYPSLFAYLLLSHEIGFLSINAGNIAGLVASPTTVLSVATHSFGEALTHKMTIVTSLLLFLLTAGTLLITKNTTLIALRNNIRPLQIGYHVGLLFIGAGLAYVFAGQTLLLTPFTIAAGFIVMMSVACAWVSTTFFNDVPDLDIDRMSNAHRPLPMGIVTTTDFYGLGILFGIISLALLFLVAPQTAHLLFFYHAISWLYNMPPLRLKRFPIIATALAAIASLMIVLIGYTIISEDSILANFPTMIGALLFVTYTLSLPLKDLKDIIGDRAHGVWTIPALFGENKARLLIGVNIFISFMLSTLIFRNTTTFFAAIICGSLCFWIFIARRNKTFFFEARQIQSLIFLLTAIYGVILVQNSFL